jgi:hypothetical protein
MVSRILRVLGALSGLVAAAFAGGASFKGF